MLGLKARPFIKLPGLQPQLVSCLRVTQAVGLG